MRSSPRCGTRVSCAASGFAVPMSRRRYTCRASAEMARMAASSPHATATAVLPTPVGPTSTGTRGRSAPPKSSLQLVLRQLYDRGPPVYVVRRERRAEQPTHQLTHLLEPEPLARLDRGPAREGGGEALEAVRPTAEPAAREIRHELLEAAGGVEARMRVGGRVHDHGPAGKRLDLVAHASQQLPVGLDGVELGGRELDREGQEQPLRRCAVTRELAHQVLVEDPLVRRVLVHDRDAGVGLEEEIRVEDLKQRGEGSGVRGRGVRGEERLRYSGPNRGTRVDPCAPNPSP